MLSRIFPLVLILLFLGCTKKESDIAPVSAVLKADFTFSIVNDGQLPAQVAFTSTSANATSYQWSFGNNSSSSFNTAYANYTAPGTYTVKLVVANGTQKDSIERQVEISPVKYKVRIFLVTPRGQTLNNDYVNAIKMCALNLQSWYKSQMAGKTFSLTDAVVETVNSQNDYAWFNQYNGTISGTDPRYYGWYNTLNDIKNIVGSSFDSPFYINIVYVAAFFEGAGGQNYAALGDADLKGLLGQSSEPVNRWIGGSGHEWGHAFGLPHPPSADNSLMWTGYTIYPSTFLRQDDKDKLNVSKFFNAF